MACIGSLPVGVSGKVCLCYCERVKERWRGIKASHSHCIEPLSSHSLSPPPVMAADDGVRNRSKKGDMNGGEGVKPPPPKAKAAKGSFLGLNWTAFFILLLTAVPAVIGGVMQLMDYLDPKGVQERMVRSRVIECYAAANPSKLEEIDAILVKYKGHEVKLLQSLSNKYDRVPQCQFKAP